MPRPLQLPHPEFSLRRAIASDAGKLARLRYQFRAELGAAEEPEPAFLDRCTRWMADRLQREGWACWVVDAAGTLRGTLWVQFLEKLPNPVGEPEHHAYFTSLYVQAAHRGGGLGSALLALALEDCTARSVDSVFLWPTPESRSLYQRHGFSDRVGMMERRLAPVRG
jgi:GNAT superfamily N-acetyltransferase